MIEIKNLSLDYDGKKVFEDYSLSIGDGITCIMGESGCGKTTLLRVIAGLLKPKSGTVTPSFVSPSIVFQEDRLFPWLTAAENVSLGAVGKQSFGPICEAIIGEAGPKERVSLMLKALELGDELNSYPSNLSGGQQRRVAIARSLVFGGDILIMDEPFKGLDDELTARVCGLIKKVRVPVLVTTHNEKTVDLLSAKSVILRML